MLSQTTTAAAWYVNLGTGAKSAALGELDFRRRSAEQHRLLFTTLEETHHALSHWSWLSRRGRCHRQRA